MITLDFSKRKDLTLCDYLYEYIKKEILSGNLKADEKLPSRRNLSSHLNVSVVTVQNAYNLLISEGYIYSVEKKGFFVTRLELKNLHANVYKKQVQENIPRGECVEEKFVDDGLNVKTKNDEVDFTSNSMNVEKFPFKQWSKNLRDVLYTRSANLLSRQSSKGLLHLRRVISLFLKEFRNMDVNPSQIVIGAGTENIFDIIIKLLGRKNVFAVENPGYKKIANLISLCGAKCIPVEIDGEGMNVTALNKSKAGVVHVSPAHHFPTGTVMSIRRRMELLSWAEKKVGRFIIEDDYDSEFRFTGKPLSTLFGADWNGHVIYMNTFSKSLSPSFRISYMVLPELLAHKFNETFSFCSCQVSAFEQEALARFIENGFYEKHLNRMKNFYKGLRNTLIGAIQKSALSSCCKIEEEGSGLHFLMKIRTKKSISSIKKNLEKRGVMISSLFDYFYDEIESTKKTALEKTFVINYSGLKRERINSAVDLLSKIVL